MPTAEEILALPKLTLDPPPRSCHDELPRPELCAIVPRMDVLVEDVEFKAQQLAYEDVPVQLPQNELTALITYTYDSQSGKAKGQNKALRKRKPDERKHTLEVWGGFLYYLLSALAKLEDVQTVVYRGYPDKATASTSIRSAGRSSGARSRAPAATWKSRSSSRTRRTA